MQKCPERSSPMPTTSPASASSWVLDLGTRKAMFVLVGATSSRPLSSNWSEGDALIGICSTACLKAHLPFTNDYLAAASCHRDHDIEKKNDGGKID